MLKGCESILLKQSNFIFNYIYNRGQLENEFYSFYRHKQFARHRLSITPTNYARFSKLVGVLHLKIRLAAPSSRISECSDASVISAKRSGTPSTSTTTTTSTTTSRLRKTTTPFLLSDVSPELSFSP